MNEKKDNVNEIKDIKAILLIMYYAGFKFY